MILTREQFKEAIDAFKKQLNADEEWAKNFQKLLGSEETFYYDNHFINNAFFMILQTTMESINGDGMCEIEIFIFEPAISVFKTVDKLYDYLVNNQNKTNG